ILELTFKNFEPIELPIMIPTKGKLAEGLSLISIQPKPASIKLLADSAGREQDSAYTEAINLNDITESSTIERKIELDKHSFQLPKSNAATVSIQMKIQKEQREWESVCCVNTLY